MSTQALRRVRFARFHAPYHENEVAGFSAHRAAELVARRVAVYNDLEAVDFDAMDRAALLAYARAHLGLVDEPPADVDDERLREALRAAAVDSASIDGLAAGPSSFDELDAMDRAHLEAYARDKVAIPTIDPAMTDDGLRAEIRALVAVALNGPRKGGKRG